MKIQLLLIAAACLLGSCRSVKKNTQDSKISVDSSTIRKSQIVDVIKSDTAATAGSRTENVKEAESGTKDQIKVVFSDTGNATAPVTITRDASGKVTIDPGGRKVQSISTSNSQKQARKDAEIREEWQRIEARRVDSLSRVAEEQARLKKETEEKDKNVARKPNYSWILWAIGSLGAAWGVFILLRKFKIV